MAICAGSAGLMISAATIPWQPAVSAIATAFFTGFLCCFLFLRVLTRGRRGGSFF